jgi:phage tail-like protein
MDARAILQLLPAAYRESERRAGSGSPLMALLSVMQEMLEPVEDTVELIPRQIDPRTCPEPLLPSLAAWLSQQRVQSVESTCERELLANLARFSAHRGTRWALCGVLRLVAGTREVYVEESTEVAFHLRVLVPQGLRAEQARIEQALEQNKPAHTTAEIVFVPGRSPVSSSARTRS